MIKFTDTNEYVDMPVEIKRMVAFSMGGELGKFDTVLGGDIFIIEEISELDQIVVDLETKATAADTVAAIDIAERMTDYSVFLLITNSAGGDSYFVPNALADHCPILQSIISATEASRKAYN